MDATLAGRGDQHSNIDAALLVSRAIFCGPKRGQSEGRYFVCMRWFALPRNRRAAEFRIQSSNGPSYRGGAQQHDAGFAVLLAIVIVGERIRGPQLLALAAIVVGTSLMYRGHANLSARSLWLLALPVTSSAIRGVIQPIVKFGFGWWPNPIAAVVVSYTVSSSVLIFSALERAGGTIPDIDHRGALWFAAVGLCNGLSVLAMYAALKYGPVTVVSPLIAGYPLVTLLLSRALLGKEDVGPQLIAGVSSTVCGVALLLVA